MKMFKSLNQEINIDEYYTGVWSEDSRHITCAGKLMDRKRWSENDNDNHIIPGPLKTFNVVTGAVEFYFDGHTEEILFLQTVNFQNQIFLLSSSQDGTIIKWETNKNFT
jgi:hypothetical protein